MAYTYLITGATSDVGTTLIPPAAGKAPRQTRWCWPRAAAIWKSWRPWCRNIPARCAPLTWTCPTGSRWMPLSGCWNSLRRRPTHFVHLPALPVVNTRFKNFDEDRFAKDLQIQLNSAIAHLPGVCAQNGKGGLWPCAVHPDQLHHRLPAQKYCCLCHCQKRHRGTGQEHGCGICTPPCHRQLRRAQHDGNPLPQGYPPT